MKRTSQIILMLLVGNLLLVACFPTLRGTSNRPKNSGQGWGWGRGNFASNGEQIYFTGTNQNGERIAYSSRSGYGGMMMSASLTCASCHGAGGRGGEHTMHMDFMDAPDIRYLALNSEEEHEEEGGHDGEYELETFRQAVVDGQHPDGDSLDRDMPRWAMNDQDLSDLLDYLKTLP